VKIAMITAGGAGMFCGSCMQDNTLVRALRLGGADAMLIPTYTPIRVDEENQSSDRVFLGGLNVYLGSMLPGWNKLPKAMTRWLDRPSLIRLLSRMSGSTDASKLGALTVDLLRGTDGPQRTAIDELIQYLCHDFRPDIIIFSNALLSGIVPSLRRQFQGSILTLLQGDDIFLEALPDRYRHQCVDLVSSNSQHFDGVLSHSEYYAGYMSTSLNIPASKFRRIPLTIDTQAGIDLEAGTADDSPTRKSTVSSLEPDTPRFTIGYFARICPEKGVDRLLDAAVKVLPQHPDVRVTIAGYLTAQHRSWFLDRLKAAQQRVSSSQIQWQGSPADRHEKFSFLKSLDLLCVPTRYREPKGLYVLEAALVGVPSLLPDHGAFPELVHELGGGGLFRAHDDQHLVEMLSQLCEANSERTLQSPNMANLLRNSVTARHSLEATAPQLMSVLREFCH
jgi:glycosyltransferase involved in cell wall biosynthesis